MQFKFLVHFLIVKYKWLRVGFFSFLFCLSVWSSLSYLFPCVKFPYCCPTTITTIYCFILFTHFSNPQAKFGHHFYLFVRKQVAYVVNACTHARMHTCLTGLSLSLYELTSSASQAEIGREAAEPRAEFKRNVRTNLLSYVRCLLYTSPSPRD